MAKLLEGKVAIVTGGGRGLGRIYCERLAEEGAKIVATDILEAEVQEVATGIKAKGGEAIALKLDITSETDTKKMAEETIKTFGRIDILVNNAAFYFGVGKKMSWDLTVEEWDQAMAVNVKGTWLCCKAVFPQMKKQNKGKIINVSSETVFSPTVGYTHYVTSKSAIIGFTHCLAGEMGPFNICVNTVAPGLTLTEASRSTRPTIDKYDVSSIPLGRLGTPEDVVGAVLYFASDLSDFVSGQTLLIDGARRTI
jgi:3-oxoacyl-[acyl-carrier protein] reductase